MSTTLPIAIYHEHQEWFRPLFAALDARGVPYVRIDARSHQYDPSVHEPQYSLVFNRMSPSAYRRGNGQGIFYTLGYLGHLERMGTRVVNGSRAFSFELSKATQLSVFESLGVPYPRTRIINQAAQAPSAAASIGYPVVVKPNIGGSGAGVARYDRAEDLEPAAELGQLDLGLDQTALVQDFVPARDNSITRVEVLGGKFLYAIQIFMTGETFNLCPGHICQTADGESLSRGICPADAPKTGLRVQAAAPPPDVIETVERIMAAAGIEVGGVEFIVDDRDGRRLFYDVNALSNFVADGPRVVGFDPYARLADYLIAEARNWRDRASEGELVHKGAAQKVGRAQ
jgi:glutathione synthase/RimK-type ligase-like ATP-grasp enzyme